jgi:hypothetical protein
MSWSELVLVPYTDPERRRAADREAKRRKRVSPVQPERPTRPLLDQATRLRTAADVLAVIEGQMAAVIGDEDLATVERARTVGYLGGVALRAIEAADLAGRVEAIEDVLGARAKALTR